MGDRLGMTGHSLRKIAREIDLVIPADQIIGKSRTRDSARIARETVQALDGLAMGVGLIDPADIDPAEAKTWTVSLTESIRTLTRFHNQIKEMTR